MEPFNIDQFLETTSKEHRMLSLQHYFNDLCPKWAGNYDGYEALYGSLDYKDKTVLDIGAEVGSTAVWFLQKGAKFVYCSERDQAFHYLFDHYTNVELTNLINNRIKYINHTDIFNGAADSTDILKMDIEGGEYDYPLEFFDSFNEFIVGLHPMTTQQGANDFMEYTNYMVKRGAQLRAIEGQLDAPIYGEFVWILKK